MKTGFAILAAGLWAAPALADDPKVIDVSVEKAGMLWNFHVTLSHPDTGWDHYADGWEVLDKAGNLLGYRELMHPHVHEQPFTRALTGIVLPDGTREVFIRPSCSRKGWSGETERVELSP